MSAQILNTALHECYEVVNRIIWRLMAQAIDRVGDRTKRTKYLLTMDEMRNTLTAATN
jgi:hypothetical protein